VSCSQHSRPIGLPLNPMECEFFYKGLPNPNGTIVPDDIFDVLMPVCTGAEFKVLAYIVRRTFGLKKESDAISLHQMVEGITKRNGKVLDRGTGLSKSAVAVAIGTTPVNRGEVSAA
jgi:hypothetical protein